MGQEKINFSVVRDFSELFNISVKFVSQNFKHFFQSMLFIAGPFLLISSICSAVYQAYIMDTVTVNQQGFSLNNLNVISHFGGLYFVILLVGIFGKIILLTTAYAYLIAYNLYGPKNFGVAEVRKIVFQNIGKTIKGFFVFFLLVFVFALIIGFIAAILIAAFKTVASVFLIIVLVILFLLSPPFIWQYSTFYLLQMNDDLGVMDAMRKVREVMRGEFFFTWLVVFATGLIILVLSVVFSVPQFVYQLILQLGAVKTMETSVPFLIVSTTCTFLITFIYSLFYIINAFLYYSLDEKKHGTALAGRIDEIGNTPLNDGDQHY
jgi:hypothetical protein